MTDTKNNVEMTFWDHLEELRWVFVRSIIAVTSLSILAFIKKDFIFDKIILAPKEPWFFTNRILCQIGERFDSPSLCLDNSHLQLINIKLSGQFTTHILMSFAIGIFFASPYIIYEIWRFIKPALRQRERKYSRGAVLVCSFLFILGVVFAYYLIVPLTINFLGNYQVSAQVANTITLSSYLSNIISLCLSMGVVFEIPVFVYFLTKTGIISPQFMKRSRKIIIVVLLIIAAIITPPDVISQTLVFIPLYFLFEISIKISEWVYKKKEASLE
ncbi:MAG TPA: twin-arginine translocase subunit TatC [Marinilabiliales bacterium]|jgi:sec-independent protein translocase protein TatC|nr:MAG: twin arginine-targeting protein translocase TatC [Bacteroidetes bacterium GWA2_40_14]OFX63312.1 MAG: twin arginine-targeting protein translocase TatC [Bacteroidetes bacterium GWC2_40_13]OFX74620.1 MAG: twin arginine-targeting protein translocase TatC [Bacteroidetes bacterium GWD2_40_43]OFX88954.1 MAG: twin arginine-targeting protein translocase TatC [Bacteroidetes bacterium GWE2_40_63]OFY22760.1 MAG: twin arginine-targeting protein translocase TatC [Bacteroidetes bacterium GWF2_40_13]O